MSKELPLIEGLRVKLSWDGQQFMATALKKLTDNSWLFEDDYGQLHSRINSSTFIIVPSPLEQLADAAD